jgi:hypothetical protein
MKTANGLVRFFFPSSSVCVSVHQCDVFFLHELTIGAAISSTLLVKQIPPHIVWLSLVPLSIIVGLRGSRDLFFFFCSLHVNRETIEQQQPPNIMKERKKIHYKKALRVVEYIYSTYKCSCIYMTHKHWPCVLHMFGR